MSIWSFKLKDDSLHFALSENVLVVLGSLQDGMHTEGIAR